MAYLTFDPSSEDLAEALVVLYPQIQKRLQDVLPGVGVAENDVVIKMLNCNTKKASEPHIEVILKTDNPKVDAPLIRNLLLGTLKNIPFEVSRLGVGYGLVEWLYEVKALFTKKRRNWASNYNL